MHQLSMMDSKKIVGFLGSWCLSIPHLEGECVKSGVLHALKSEIKMHPRDDLYLYRTPASISLKRIASPL